MVGLRRRVRLWTTMGNDEEENHEDDDADDL